MERRGAVRRIIDSISNARRRRRLKPVVSPNHPSNFKITHLDKPPVFVSEEFASKPGESGR